MSQLTIGEVAEFAKDNGSVSIDTHVITFVGEYAYAEVPESIDE